MGRRLRWRLVPLHIVALLICIPVAEHVWQLHKGQALAHYIDAKPAVLQPIEGIPSRIVVPNATIDLPVVTTDQDPVTHIWPVSNTAANYAFVSALANNTQGQTFIYGHATDRIFGHLLDLHLGDEAYVYTQNNHVFTYRYQASHDTTPTDTSVLSALRTGTGLVLMTCDGNQFTFRHLMYFSLVRVT